MGGFRLSALGRPPVLAAALVAAAGCHLTSVAVQPLNNHIFHTVDEILTECDDAGKDCKQKASFGFKPIAAAIDPSGANLFFITATRLYRCDGGGQNCTPVKLSFIDAAAVAVGSSRQAVVVSSHGAINLCDATQCKVPTK